MGNYDYSYDDSYEEYENDIYGVNCQADMSVFSLRFLMLVIGSISNRFHYQKDLETDSRPITALGLDPASNRSSTKKP